MEAYVLYELVLGIVLGIILGTLIYKMLTKEILVIEIQNNKSCCSYNKSCCTSYTFDKENINT